MDPLIDFQGPKVTYMTHTQVSYNPTSDPYPIGEVGSVMVWSAGTLTASAVVYRRTRDDESPGHMTNDHGVRW